MPFKPRQPLLGTIAALLIATALPQVASAGQIWDGGGSNGLWSNALNWDGDTAPNFALALQFAGTSQLSSSNNSATTTVAGLIFNADAGSFTLSGSPITLGGNIVNNSATFQTISFAIPGITLGGSQTFDTGSVAGGQLFVTSRINAGANTLTLDGANPGRISGVIAGTGAVTKTGTGAWTLAGTNTYTGDTNLLQGTLYANTANALGTGNLNISAGTRIGSTVDRQSIANKVNALGDFTIEANTHLKFTGAVDLNGGTRAITGSTVNAEISFTGVISNGGVTFNSPVNYTSIIIGAGNASDVANTYTGLTTVNDNVYLVLNKGTGTDFAIGGDVVQNGSGSLDYFRPNQISDTAAVTINGPGNLLGSDRYAGMQLNNNNETIGSLFGASTGLVQLGTATLTVGAGNFAGVIADGFSGPGGKLTKNTAGTLILAGANTYTGATTISAGTLQIGDGGTTGSLASPAIGTVAGSVLAFNRSNALTVGGLISGAGAVNQIGTGVTTLTGPNTYTGVTTLSAGTINLGSLEIVGTSGPLGRSVAANPGSIVLTGGTLQYSAVNQNDYSGRFSTAAGQAYNADTNGQNVTWATALTSVGGALTKSGAGTLTLTAANTYDGATTVNNGTLLLDFSAPGAPTMNIINNTANSSTLVLGGGALVLTGRASTANVQNVNGLTINAGVSSIRLNAATANPLVLNLGAITTSPGGTVNFTLPSGVQSATNGITTSTLNSSGILGAFATVGGTDFAVNATDTAGGNIVGLSSVGGYTLTSVALDNPANYARANISVDSSQTPTGPINPNTLRFDTAAPETLTLTGNNVINTGGILVTSNVGGNLSTLTGGTLTSGSGDDLTIIQNNTAGGLTIGSVIVDGIESSTGLSKAGPGTLTLTAANTYTGGTAINGGRIAVTATGRLGTGGITFTDVGELLVDGSTFSSSEPVTIEAGASGRLSNGNAGSPATFTGLFTLGANSTLAIGSAGNTGAVVLTPTSPAIVDSTAHVAVDFGTLRNGNADGFQKITSLAASTTVAAGAALDANGFGSTIKNLLGAGTLTNSSGTATTYTIQSGLFGGVIEDGASQISLTKTTAGELRLGGQNTYSGITRVEAGILSAGAEVIFDIGGVAVSGAFAPASAFIVTGTLDLAGFSNSIGSLAGPASGIVQNGGLDPATLFIGSNNTDTTFAGLIRDGDGLGAGRSLDIVKVGSGRQTLSGNNTYTGNTFLREGELFADVTPGNPANQAFGTGQLVISGGTTLGSTVDSQTISNDTTVLGDFTIEANTRLSLTGDINLAGGVRAITGVVNASEISFSGVIGNGGVTFNTAGLVPPSDGTAPYVAFIYNGFSAHAYTGLTTINSGAFLVFTTGGLKVVGDVLVQGNGVVDYLGGSNQISDTATVTVNSSGSTISGPTPFQGFELFNKTDTIGALFGSGTVGLGSGILTVGAGNFAGVIKDGFAGMTDTRDPAGGVGGQLTKNTPGTLILTGKNTYTGNTNINNGVLVLDGSVQSPTVAINFAGTLMGTGMAAHNVTNSGVFSPGKSAGTFTIGGNYIQSPAGTLIIEIAGKNPGQHDLVNVGGQAALSGNLRLVDVKGTRLKVGDKITFLTARGGVLGEFATVDNPFASSDSIVTTDVIYEANAVSLAAVQGSFAEFAALEGLTPNQRAVASALDRISSNKKQAKLIDFLDDQPLANLPHDFDLIAAEEIQALYTLGFAQANVQTANLIRRLDDIRAGAAGFSAAGLAVSGLMPQYSGSYLAPNSGLAGPEGKASTEGPGTKEIRPPKENRYGVFFTGVGEWTHVGTTQNASGYDLASGGFTLGFDYKINEHFAVGINAGYARSSAELSGNGDVTVDGGKFGVYATYFNEGFYVDAALQGGFNSYDTRRSALQGAARGTTSGGEFNALLAVGYDFKSNGVTFGPTASLQYTNIGFNGYGERGSLAPLNYESQSAESYRTALGMKANYEWHIGGVVVKPELRAAWQHHYGDSAYGIESVFANGGDSFNVEGAEIGRDSLLLGAGFAVLWNERTATYVYYDGDIARSNYSSNNISGGVRLEF